LDTSSLDAELIYTIDEGERSKFRSIFLFGLEEIPALTYRSICRIIYHHSMIGITRIYWNRISIIQSTHCLIPVT